jgi:hypothetical protein
MVGCVNGSPMATRTPCAMSGVRAVVYGKYWMLHRSRGMLQYALAYWHS